MAAPQSGPWGGRPVAGGRTPASGRWWPFPGAPAEQVASHTHFRKHVVDQVSDL